MASPSSRIKASPFTLSCQVYTNYQENFEAACAFGLSIKQSLFCRPSPRCGVPHEDHGEWHKALLRHVAHIQMFVVHIVVCLIDSYVLWTADMPPFQGAKRKLLAAGRSGPCRDLKVWVQQVKNHRYYCAALGEGNGPLLVSMSMSPLKHIINMHGGHDGPYYECLHQPLSDRAWLAVGKLTILSIVHHSRAAILMWRGEGRENRHASIMSHSCICTLHNTVSANMASAPFRVFFKQGQFKSSQFCCLT